MRKRARLTATEKGILAICTVIAAIRVQIVALNLVFSVPQKATKMMMI